MKQYKHVHCKIIIANDISELEIAINTYLSDTIHISSHKTYTCILHGDMQVIQTRNGIKCYTQTIVHVPK